MQKDIYSNTAILIPSLNPDENFISIIDGLSAAGFLHIIVVNDGSAPELRYIFDRIEQFDTVTVLHHAVNLGKGRALKTGFNYALANLSHLCGVVTADSDGQHTCKDILRTAEALLENPDTLILGSRDFSQKIVPKKSRFGNVITRNVFRLLCGIKVSDTQTGLRGIPSGYMRGLMNVCGERFEFEMNMLVECREKAVPIKEVPIETVYLNGNKSSKFNPLLDSYRVYMVFIKYIISALLSFSLDLFLFWLAFAAARAFDVDLSDKAALSAVTMAATVSSRVGSSIFNYIVNRTAVFKQKCKNTVYKYYALAAVQMLLSGAFVFLLCNYLAFPEMAAKIPVDLGLAIFSFTVQKEWVFKNRKQLRSA